MHSAAAEPGVIEASLTQQLRDLDPPRAGRWLVGFSGGLDSTVLLHLLCKHLADRPVPPTLVALHVNHGMQADADRWQSHCHQYCAELGVSFVAEAVAVAKTASPEAAAREARYRVFSRNLGPGDALFLAHHRDDQVETLLLRLLRGAGPRGMSAMPRRRQLGQGQLFRPLLSLTRDALQAYAKGAGLRWLDDPSNLDDQLDRNFLRNQVLPLVASRWPGYRATLARASQLLGEQEDLLEELTGQSELRRNRFGEVGLPLEQLPGDEPALTARRLRSFVRSQGLPVPSRESLTEFLRQLATAADAAGITLETAGWVLQVFDGVVWLLPSGPVPPTDWSGQLALGQSLELGWLGRVVLDVDEAGPLRLVPGETLNLRLRGGGEMVSTPAGRRSLKKLLQEARIPPWWRARLPLLYRGEQLLAVADIATATGQGAASGVGCRLRWFPPRAN